MKIDCTVKAPCEHPASGLLLVPGEMEVSEAAGRAVIAAGLAKAAIEREDDGSTVTFVGKKGKAEKPSPREEGIDHGKG